MRPNNEDGLLLHDRVVTGDMDVPEHGEAKATRTLVFAVADGMGGCACGEIACRVLLESLRDGADAFADPPDESEAAHILARELTGVHRRMNRMAADDPAMSGMGSAIAGVVILPSSVLVFNVGDCRVYRSGNNGLYKVTHDHSVVQQLCDEGKISEDDMRIHPMKNRVTSAVMSGMNPPRLFATPLATEADERLFVCSDGVWEALPLETLSQCVCVPGIEAAARKLFDELSQSGCDDNVTFILLDIERR